MSATFGSISNLAHGARTNSTVPAPSGIITGNGLLLIFKLADETSAPDYDSLPSGFVLLDGSQPISSTHASGFQSKFWVAGKTADLTDESATDYTITHSGATSAVTMMRILGVSPSWVADAIVNSANGIGTTTTVAGIMVSDDDNLLVYSGIDYAGSTANTVVPAGMTERLDAIALYVATQDVDAGATGDKSTTNGNTGGTDTWSAFLISISPTGDLDPPVNTVAPVITGLPVVGEVLMTDDGTWDNSPTGFTYQWQRLGP